MNIIILLIYLLNFYTLIILARVLLTWVPNLDYSNPIVRFLFDVTEPVLKPIRDVMPPRSGLDFSPIVVIIIITILTRVLLNL